MDREGVHRMTPQGIKNKRTWDDPRCVEDARGWVQPFANWQGWDELNHAVHALRCVMLFKRIGQPLPAPVFRDDGTIDRAQLHRGMSEARIESDMSGFHFHLGRSRRCDRPALP